MKASHIITLLALGCATMVGLGVLFNRVFPNILSSEPAILAPVLVIAVASALFVFGIFMGYLYSSSSSEGQISKETMQRFHGALNFERKERVRLERALVEAKQLSVSLENRLQKEALKLHDKETPGDETQEKLSQLQSEVSELTTHQERLRTDLLKRKERIADLLAELSVVQVEAEEAITEVKRLRSSSFPPSSPVMEFLTEGSSIKDVLEGIVSLDGIQIALVADDYGLVVETAGDAVSSDTLAAISSLIADIGSRVRDILPMGEIATVSLGDDKGLVIDTHYFELLGTKCALAISRDAAYPYSGLTEQAINSIAARLTE